MSTNESTQQAAMLGEPWVSSNLIGNLDPAYTPGPEEDFYVYENREWLLSAGIDDGEFWNRPLAMVAQHMVQDRCAELLAEGGSEVPEIRSAQNYYALLRDWEWRNKTGVAPLEETINRIDAVSTIDELNELFCDPDPLRRIDLLSMTTMQDVLDGNKNAAYAVMGVTVAHEKDAAEYRNPTPTGLVMLQVQHDTYMYIANKTSIADRAEAIWQTSLAYQTEMTEFYPTAADQAVPSWLQNMGKQRVTQAELIDLLGAFPTKRVIEAHGYEDVDEFILIAPKNDEFVAAHYDEEHLEGIKALIITALIKNNEAYLTQEIYEEGKRIDAEALGYTVKNDEEDQRRKAFIKVFEAMPSAVSKLYVSRYGDEEMRQEIREMCNNIVRVYKKMLTQEDWLSESTRSYAIEKLDAMKFRVLYPDKWEDYSALDIRSAEEGETLWSAHLKAAAFQDELARSYIGKEADSDIMPKCIETNCNYNPTNNSVNIYIGFLSELSYSSTMSLEEKMGALGMVIGHEISHGFDTHGKLYDKHGVAAEWWTAEDSASFDARAQKAMDWYENVYKPRTETMPGIGLRSVGETIADLGSLSVAMTLARDVEGFDYDKFFRANARVWRLLENDFAFDYMLQTDEHPQNNLRVDLTLAQCDEFHKTYGVKPGDKMYFAPEDRLRVW